MDHPEIRDENSVVNEGRRKLVKAAAVAGGVVAAIGVLPGEWKKPLATVGGLPAHAQTSADPPIHVTKFTFLGIVGPFDNAPADSSLYNGGTILLAGKTDFADSLCQMDDTVSLWVNVDFCGEILEFPNKMLGEWGATFISGDKCAGEIQFNFNASTVNNCSPTGTIAYQLSKGNRKSEVMNASFTMPVN